MKHAESDQRTRIQESRALVDASPRIILIDPAGLKADESLACVKQFDDVGASHASGQGSSHRSSVPEDVAGTSSTAGWFPGHGHRRRHRGCRQDRQRIWPKTKRSSSGWASSKASLRRCWCCEDRRPADQARSSNHGRPRHACAMVKLAKPVNVLHTCVWHAPPTSTKKTWKKAEKVRLNILSTAVAFNHSGGLNQTRRRLRHTQGVLP